MQRVIKDYQNVQKHHLDLIAEHYPTGFDVEDLIRFTIKDVEVKCLQIKTDEVIYLFKMDQNMVEILDEHSDDEFDLSDIEDYYNEEY